MTHPEIAAESQKLATDDMVDLFILDCTSLGGPVLRFTPNVYANPATGNNARILFQGAEYQPHSIQISGMVWTGEGPLPRPRLSMFNGENVIGMAVVGLGDALGAKLTRLRTFRKYLDLQSSANPSAHYDPEVWIVNRKTRHDPIMIEWELTSVLDQENVEIPLLVAIRNTCTHTYRRFTGTAFDYTGVTCPYTGSNYFDQNGNATTAAGDRCGRQAVDCQLRFPQPNALPTRALLGIPRV